MVFQHFFFSEIIGGIFSHVLKIYLYFLFWDLSGESVIYKMFLPYNLRQDTKTQNLKGKDGYILITNF